MKYEEKYQELVELSHSDAPKIKEKADAWQTAIGLQDVDGLKVSPYLLDTARQHSKRDITIDETGARITQRLPKSQFDTFNIELL